MCLIGDKTDAPAAAIKAMEEIIINMRSEWKRLFANDGQNNVDWALVKVLDELEEYKTENGITYTGIETEV